MELELEQTQMALNPVLWKLVAGAFGVILA